MTSIVLLAAAAENAPIVYADGPNIPWLRIVLVFVLCIALAVGAIGFLRVRNGLPLLPDELRMRVVQSGERSATISDERIQIVQRLSVTPSSQLVVLKRGRQNYLLHLTHTGATEIDRYSDDEVGEPS